LLQVLTFHSNYSEICEELLDVIFEVCRIHADDCHRLKRITLNIAVEQLALLLCIWKVPGSDFGPDTDCPD
jgi:hypothetical protein